MANDKLMLMLTTHAHFFVFAQASFSHSHVCSLCVPGVSVRTAWISWWAREPLTRWKMLIPGAATFASLHSVAETSNSDRTGVWGFKTSLPTTAPWSLYVLPSSSYSLRVERCSCRSVVILEAVLCRTVLLLLKDVTSRLLIWWWTTCFHYDFMLTVYMIQPLMCLVIAGMWGKLQINLHLCFRWCYKQIRQGTMIGAAANNYLLLIID